MGNPTTSLATAYQSQGADKALPAAGPSSSGPSAATNQLRASGSQTANDAVPPIKPASFYNAAKQSPNADAPTEGTASITSEPGEADIFIDSVGQGRAPALLKLPAGRHSVQLVLSGYKDWVSDVIVKAGSIVNVTADFEK